MQGDVLTRLELPTALPPTFRGVAVRYGYVLQATARYTSAAPPRAGPQTDLANEASADAQVLQCCFFAHLRVMPVLCTTLVMQWPSRFSMFIGVDEMAMAVCRAHCRMRATIRSHPAHQHRSHLEPHCQCHRLWFQMARPAGHGVVGYSLGAGSQMQRRGWQAVDRAKNGARPLPLRRHLPKLPCTSGRPG